MNISNESLGLIWLLSYLFVLLAPGGGELSALLWEILSAWRCLPRQVLPQWSENNLAEGS